MADVGNIPHMGMGSVPFTAGSLVVGALVVLVVMNRVIISLK